MKQTVENFQQEVKRDYMKKGLFAHVEAKKGCPATPAPTLPVSLCDYWNSIVGAGLSDSQQLNVGVREVEVRRKETAWKTPQPVPTGTGFGAGFSKPFPECRPSFAGPFGLKF